MANIEDILLNQRSVRKFNDTPITDDGLSAIVEAGRWAPTGGNCQTVHFLVITNKDVLATLRLREKVSFLEMKISDDQYISIQNSIKLAKQENYVYDYNAPVLVVASNRRGYPNAIADSMCPLKHDVHSRIHEYRSCWIKQLHWLDKNLFTGGLS